MYFFDGRQMKHNCFHFGLRSDLSGAGFETAMNMTKLTLEDVNEVIVPKMGDIRVKG